MEKKVRVSLLAVAISIMLNTNTIPYDKTENAGFARIISVRTEEPVERVTYNYDESIFDIEAVERDYNPENKILFEGIEYVRSDESIYKEKFDQVCEMYGLTPEELDTVCAVCVQESYGTGNAKYDLDGKSYDKGASYRDSYMVANSIYNRLHSRKWVPNDNYLSHKEGVYSLYKLVISPSQYQPYGERTYKKHLGRLDLMGYQAAIDMFYTQEVVHNFMSFRGSGYTDEYMYNLIGYYPTEYVKGGNKFFSPLKDIDYVENNITLESLNLG